MLLKSVFDTIPAMRAGSLAICLALLFVLPTLAHPPAGISAGYDSIERVLTITVSHRVADAQDHFIKNIKVLEAGKLLFEQNFDRQFDQQEQVMKVYLPWLEGTNWLTVAAECSKFGSKQEVIGVEVLPYADISAARLQLLMEENPDLIILDVSPNYFEGHIPDARYYYLPELRKRIGELDPSKPYLVYARKAEASIDACLILAEQGFSRIYRLEGGYGAWIEAGCRIEQ